MTVLTGSRSLAAVVASLIATAAMGTRAASGADEDPVVQCIAASNKGLDLRKQGKLIEARQVLAACAAPSCGSEISGVCQKRIADIGAALPTIVFLPKDPAGNDLLGVKMTVDGASSPVTLDGRPFSVDPGPHSFRFEAEGFAPVTRTFILAEGAKDRQERIDVGRPPGQAPAPAGAAISTPPPEPRGSAQRTLGWMVGGVGVVGVAAGSVFGLLAMSKWSASKSDCSAPATPSNCPRYTNAVSEHDDASTFGTISTAAFVGGGLALATGVAFVLTAPTSSPTLGGVRLGPEIGPGGVGLTMSGVFR